jgi:hypothetical protein
MLPEIIQQPGLPLSKNGFGIPLPEENTAKFLDLKPNLLVDDTIEQISVTIQYSLNVGHT